MIKLSTVAIAGGLFLASFSAPAWAVTTIQDAPAPYLTTSRSVPRNARAPFAKYQLGLNVAGYKVSQITIGIPELMTVGKVSVRGADGQVIEASTTVEDRTAVIKFAQPISPNTQLKIELSSVRTLSMVNRVWLLPIAVRKAESANDLSIGMARIHTYNN